MSWRMVWPHLQIISLYAATLSSTLRWRIFRLVAGGHATKAPATLTYASIMSRETMRIALLMAALNNIDIWAADVLNAYITAPCQEKILTTLGKEFGDDCGRKAIVVRALY